MTDRLPGLTEGRSVHYVLTDAAGERAGEHRPAIIVRVADAIIGVVTLAVFTDGDADRATRDVLRLPGIIYDANGAQGTWHWIE